MAGVRVMVVYALLAGLIAGAQTVTNVIDAFNTNSYPNNAITNRWSYWFGNAFQSLSLDRTSDANTNATSGSLKIALNFPGTANEQFTVWDGITAITPTLNGIQFTNLQCDIRFGSGSATNSSGNFGSLQLGMGTPSYGQDYYSPSVTVSAGNTNWVHVSIPLNVNTDPNLYNIANVFVHIYDGAGSLSGASTLWIDNIQFVGMATNTGKVTINYTNTQQRIDGFGASSAWMGSALSSADADLLFSTNTGAGLSLLRTRIAPGGVIDDAEGTIAQEAQARGARVWSTPWSPATTFKSTNSVNGGSFVSSAANDQGYATQLVNYIASMKTYGVNLFAVSVQNEPDFDTSYESCVWTSQQIHDFVPYFNTALTNSNSGSTKIMLPENSAWSWSLATNTMDDTITSNLVGILACHNYGSAASPVTQFGTPCPKTLWETEHYLGTGDDITNGLELAQEIHSFLTVAQVNAYHYWWLAGSGTGSIADNTANPAKRLFVLGNYSRFVRPNFYRVAATNNTTALITAFKATNSANFVIVAANPTAYPVNQTFVLTNFPMTGALTQWVTTASLSLANQGTVNVTNNSFTYLLPAWSTISFIYNQPLTPVITQQPTNQSGFIHESVTFDVGAGGGTPLFYQWVFNGTNSILEATNSSLTLTSLTTNAVGNYSVIVTNYAGSITSGVATLTVSAGANFELATDDGFGASSFNTPGNWTNSSSGAAATFAPASGYSYATGPFVLRTPANAGNYTFGGDVLTISSGGSLNIKGGNGNAITFGNLFLSGTINNSINPNNNAVLAGNLTVVGSASFNTQSTNGDIRAITNAMNIFGSGTLTNTSLGASTATGTVVLTGNNTNFTGSLVVNGSTILQAASPTALGGNPAVFNAAQLVLDGGTFQPLTSMSLKNLNSGITISAGGGRFSISRGIVLTNLNAITGPGTVTCSGGGTLMLGGINTATGNLVVSNATLALVGPASLGNSVLAVNNQATLDVSGLAVPVIIGNQISLAGNLIVAVNGNGNTSQLMANNILYGGTLIINNNGPAFAASNAFSLFSAGNYTGNFAAISPPTPGPGLAWNTSSLALNGTLSVAATPSVSVMPPSTNIVYGNSIALTANVAGTSPIYYQWFDNFTNAIVWATNATLNLTNPALAASGNYTLNVSNAFGQASASMTLTVSAAPLLVAAYNTNRLYGSINPAFTANYSGFVGGDTLASSLTGSPNLSTTATTSSSVGVYPVTTSAGTLAATNYSLSFSNATLTVNPAPLGVTANDTNKTYGTSLDFIGLEFTTVGLVDGDAVTNISLASDGGNTNATVGTYNITAANALGLGLTNYVIHYTAGTLTVTPAALTITADNINKAIGTAFSFTGTEFTVAGLTNTDWVTNATLTSAGADSSALSGNYPVTITNAQGSGLTNYVISYEIGTLTVTGAVALNTTNILALVSGNNLQLSWPADHIGWWVQAQTNNLGTNWFSLPGSTSTNLMFVPINSTNQSVFYRLASP